PLHDSDPAPTNSPLRHDQPEDHPTRSTNVTAPRRWLAGHDRVRDALPAVPVVAVTAAATAVGESAWHDNGKSVIVAQALVWPARS
ncbi:hypothetical protein AB0916_39890, partial [Streptomyces sp. NPDC005476]